MVTKTQNYLTEILKDLIQMRTLTSDQEANRQALDWFKWQLSGLPVHIADYESGGYQSTVITTRPTKNPKLLMLGHIDVVPAGDNQFEPAVRRGRLYGRGVLDMKFAIAAYLKLLLDLGENLAAYDLGVMITTDEEDSGDFGGGYLAPQYRPQVVVNPDATSNWDIEAGAKGVVNFRVEAAGRAGHSSRTWETRNAIDMLMAFLADLKKDFTAEPCGDAGHLHDTLNIGTIRGGEVTNSAAGRAEAMLDLRFMPERAPEEIIKSVQSVADRHPGVSVSVTRTGSSFRVDVKNPLVREYAAIVKNVTGAAPGTSFSHGTSDSRFFAVQGIPTIACRAGGGVQHSSDEWVSIKGLNDFYAILREYARRIAKV